MEEKKDAVLRKLTFSSAANTIKQREAVGVGVPAFLPPIE